MMNTNNTRTIHTKLYSEIALEVLQSVEGQLSDGMWESSLAMEKYWWFSNVEAAPDGEVIIKVNTESSKYDMCYKRTQINGFYDMTDTEIIKWFAAKVKHIMQAELKDEDIVGGWKRDNDKFETRYLNYNEKITVRDVYFIYDFLMGRDVTKKYEGVMSLKIVSAPKPDEETKYEEARRQNEAKICEEWLAARNKLDAEKKQKIQAIEDEYRKAIDEVNAKYRKFFDELQAAC